MYVHRCTCEEYMEKDYLHKLCNEYNIGYYTINDDLSIDINYNFYINRKELNEMPPFKINKVLGNFNCSYNNLTSLHNSPKQTEGYFMCSVNKLTSLKGSPEIVNGYFDCDENNLTSLEYLPKVIKGNIYCNNNNIKSFKGIPEDFTNGLYCRENPIDKIYKLFRNNSKCIYWLNEYDVIRDDSIILDRLEEVFYQLNMDIPIINKIEGYNLI